MTDDAPELPPGEETRAVEALISIAVSANLLRLAELEGFPAGLRNLVREDLWTALDQLEMTAPAFFARVAAEDAAWIEEHRRRGGLAP